jgi:hypothetical protein
MNAEEMANYPISPFLKILRNQIICPGFADEAKMAEARVRLKSDIPRDCRRRFPFR